MAVHSSVEGSVSGSLWRGRVLLAIAISAGLASSALAQSTATVGRLSIAPTVGVAIPTGTFGEYAEPGPTAGLRIGYEVAPGISLIADGGIDFLKGTNLSPGTPRPIWTPEMRMQRYIAGLEAKLGTEDTAPWSVLASVGAGASLLNTDEYRNLSGTTQKFDYTAFTAAGGLELGYALSRRLELVADGRLYWSLMDKDRTEALAAIRPVQLDPFRTAVTLPLVLALRTRV